MCKPLIFIVAMGASIAATATLFAAPHGEKQDEQEEKSSAAIALDEFMEHVIDGRMKEAVTLTDPKSLREPQRQLEEFQQVKNLKDLRVIAVYAAEKRALGISSPMFLAEQRGNLVIRAEKADAKWLVIDLDFHNADEFGDSVYTDLGEFWYRNPDARPVRLDQSQDDQGQAKEDSAN